jgi:hypothetical protein
MIQKEKRENHMRDDEVKPVDIARLQKWFDGPKSESDGGYAKVSDDDWYELHDLFYGLIEARWEEDPDGDLPVEFRLTNRNTHERNHFQSVPRAAEVDNDYDSPDYMVAQAEHIKARLLNLKMAQEHLYPLDNILRWVEKRGWEGKP